MGAEITAPVLVIGAGACGLVAALAAADAGAIVVVLERDRTPSGSTALSSGFIPAAATRFQRAIGVPDDTPEMMAADILAKSRHQADPAEAARAARGSGPALEWLADRHGIPFHVLEGFLYPGHSRLRMHAVPERTGTALMARLLAATEAAGVQILTQAHATALFADMAGHVHGVRLTRPDGATEDIACDTLILACNGYGGAPELVRAHIPEMAEALYFGHTGNQGDALRWGLALRAEARDLGACQGHGSVAHPHGALITWALMMDGGIQVNRDGLRFWNEHEGYSEAAIAVLAQPGGIAWDVYDDRLHRFAMDFEDYRTAEAAGAIRTGTDADALATACGLAPDALAATIAQAQHAAQTRHTDAFGRHFTTPPLAPPFHAVRVTGALFHTQGGLVVDDTARMLRRDGTQLPNLFAGGGAARGVSGSQIAGYLSGNGLLTAVTLGRAAGRAAAELSAA
jgi:fumarate reductase flavoprotein subunit